MKRRLKRIKRIFLRIFGCNHKYSAYISVKDGRRRWTIWKCKRCGKEKMGL